MIINFGFGGGGGASDPKKLDVEVFNQFTQEQAVVDESQNEAIEGIEGDITRIDSKIDDIELFKFPNATIIGEPTIQNGQISDFSTASYLQFPFILDLHNQAFQIDFCFTTATNVQTQQNILDSKFGIALAISGGKGLMAISSNGTDWNIGSIQGSMDIESNTTYYARLSWDGIQYKTFLSTDGVDYTQDMVLVGAQRPHPTTIFIGGCDIVETGHTPHPFLGTINLNKAKLTVMGNVVWQGMDDAGLATRLATNLNNIDETGIERLNELVELKTINGESIKGEGDIIIESGGDKYEISFDLTQSVKTSTYFTIRKNGVYITNASVYGRLQNKVSGESLTINKSGNYYYFSNGNYLVAAINIYESGKQIFSGIIPLYTNIQDKLTSGSNIKTINGLSLLGSGNIDLGQIEMTATLEDGTEVAYTLYGKQNA